MWIKNIQSMFIHTMNYRSYRNTLYVRYLLLKQLFKDAGNYATLFAMLGKGFVTIGFSAIYIFSTEIFPTEVRIIAQFNWKFTLKLTYYVIYE